MRLKFTHTLRKRSICLLVDAGFYHSEFAPKRSSFGVEYVVFPVSGTYSTHLKAQE